MGEMTVLPEPETEETFDSMFWTEGLDAQEIAERIDDEMSYLRADVGDFVRRLFMKHGYFNGNTDNTVTHDKDENLITCTMIVRCYGLPLLAEREKGE